MTKKQENQLVNEIATLGLNILWKKKIVGDNAIFMAQIGRIEELRNILKNKLDELIKEEQQNENNN